MFQIAANLMTEVQVGGGISGYQLIGVTVNVITFGNSYSLVVYFPRNFFRMNNQTIDKISTKALSSKFL